MAFFVRVSELESIASDIERGFSSWMGCFSMEDAAGLEVLDIEEMSEDEIIEELEYLDWHVGTDGMWRKMHHDGLSCHLITENDVLTQEDIIAVVKELGTELGCGSNHEAMTEGVVWIGSINQTAHIFWADDYKVISE